jgi:pimeloyl-ACP methyl ester carboxylesterase
LTECAVQRAHLVPHDFGGPWGLAWAAANPGAIASVTLIDTGVLLDYRWHYLALIWQTPWLGELFMATTTRAGMRLLLRYGNPRGLPVEYVDQAFDNFDAATRRAVLRLCRNSRRTNGAMQDIAHVLRPLDLPAQVVWGAHDPYISVDFAERQRAVFPRAEVVICRTAGTGLLLTIPTPSPAKSCRSCAGSWGHAELIRTTGGEETARLRPAAFAEGGN